MSSKSTTIFILISIMLICTCFNPFAPKLQDSPNLNQLITDQQTPEEVLTNFKYAYSFKDSTLYADVLDSSFVFLYFDPNLGSSGRFVSWGRDVDLLTTGRLFRNANVIDLIWHSTIYSLGDTLTAELSKSFNLSIITKEETISISGNAIFTLKRNLKDRKWRITRWKDESDL